MITTKTYESGFRLVVEERKGSTVFFNQYVKVGSQDEAEDEQGLAHFIEHLMFKSTDTRSTNEINQELDFLGCSSNAFTTYDNTCFFFKSIKENFEKALTVFADMLQNGIYKKEEVDLERDVVLQEINMYKDDSEDVSINATMADFYNGTCLAHPISGSEEIVKNSSIDKLKQFKQKHYTSDNIIISVVGDITFDEMETLVKKYFPKYFEGKATAKQYATNQLELNVKDKFCIVNKDDTQVRWRAIIKGENIYSSELYKQAVYTIILGGGLTSRLFVKIREELGLAYNTYAESFTNNNAGALILYLGTTNENLETAITLVKNILKEMADGVTQYEMDKAKNLIKASLIFAEESAERKALKNAKDLFIWGRVRENEEDLKQIDSITIDDVNEFAKKIYNESTFATCAVGKDIDINDLKKFDK